MNISQIKILERAQGVYLTKAKGITTEHELIRQLHEEHIYVVEKVLLHMVKEKTIHRSDELVSILKRVTNVLLLLFSSDSASSAVVASIKHSLSPNDPKNPNNNANTDSETSIEQIFQEIEALANF
ncbi:hypothetical protein L1D18_15965 [Vibrio parahaemolyticus]|uniref:hypothetical protein n=1 Tax=Vibrio parahaemolyticus TaxID=670 RepID=UPI001D52529D|nr:hypothetical protein [Vibrio parahaemolyticus]EHH1100890.1 hypothetical protein [Vibrio parahaemolyticus]MCG9645608.1 hypothetical protein [Vibrio parahaemolyticus]